VAHAEIDPTVSVRLLGHFATLLITRLREQY
jgi:hypothetical protein